MTCPRCGVGTPPDAQFCGSCGAKMAGLAGLAGLAAFPPPAAETAPTKILPETDVVPVQTAPTAPPHERPHRSPHRPPSKLPMIAGLVALAMVSGGTAYFILNRDSGDGDALNPLSTTIAEASDTSTADPGSTAQTTVTASTSLATTTAPTTTTAPDPLTSLQTSVAADAATVEALVGQWVPQVSSKRPGIEDDGITYQLADIVALHDSLRAQYGAVMLWSGDYNYQTTDLWVSIVPTGYATPADALQFCTDNAIGRDDCFAKLITHDMTITDTVELQP